MNAAKLVDSLSLEEVVAWASLMQLEYEKPATFDDCPAREAALRAALADKFNEKLFGKAAADKLKQPPEEELPPGIQLRLGALVREAMIDKLYDLGLVLTPPAVAYDNFFDEHTKGDEEYRQRVSDYCCKYYTERKQEIVQLLKKGG